MCWRRVVVLNRQQHIVRLWLRQRWQAGLVKAGENRRDRRCWEHLVHGAQPHTLLALLPLVPCILDGRIKGARAAATRVAVPAALKSIKLLVELALTTAQLLANL